jgi:hypothetical protein
VTTINLYTGKIEDERPIMAEVPTVTLMTEEKPTKLELTKEDIEKLRENIEKLRGWYERAKEFFERIREEQAKAKARKALEEAGIEVIKPTPPKPPTEFEKAMEEAGVEVVK